MRAKNRDMQNLAVNVLTFNVSGSAQCTWNILISVLVAMILTALTTLLF
jgi:hypothetical protein